MIAERAQIDWPSLNVPDTASSGKTKDLRSWWDKLLSMGPAYGYYPNAQKTWLIVKTEHKASAEAAFLVTQINVTIEGGLSHVFWALG